MRTLIALLVLLTAWPALGATTINGGNIINQTWTPAGSPYVVLGDINVPNGSTLVMQAGTEVQFASSDGQASGVDTSRIEVTVSGTLTVSGTGNSPVTLHAQNGTAPRTWYGIIVTAGAASVTIDNALIQHAQDGVQSAAPGNVLAINNSTFQTHSNAGVNLSNGTPMLNTIVSTGSTYGVQVGGSAAPTIMTSRLQANTSVGLYVGSTGGITTLTDSTVYGHPSYGVYIAGNNNESTVVRNCVITNNTVGGIGRVDASSVSVTYSDVWGNGTNYFGGASAGTGSFSANPIYVGAPGNLRLTSNSPARFAGNTGGDIGALPYVSDPTPGLYGTLWTNTQLSIAGSPYTLAGDLTIPTGVTLTVDPGVTLTFASSDLMAANVDTTRAELIVRGTLIATGTKPAPILITCTNKVARCWYGIELLATAVNSTLIWATVEAAQDGVQYGATGAATINHTVFRTNSNAGLFLTAGAPAIDAVTATGNLYGIQVSGSAGPTITNAVLQGNSSVGLYNGGTSNTTTLENATIYGHPSYGIYIAGNNAELTVIRNCVITNNTVGGVGRVDASSVSVTYSDVWGNGTNYFGGTAPGAGCLSTNPQYVNAPSDLHLMGTSVAIDSGNATGAPNHDRDDGVRPTDGDGINGAAYDMGAYEFAAALNLCGNGVVDNGEACDDGMNNGGYGFCNSTCTGLGPRCGDGMVNGPEQCDDGNQSNTDACLTTCKSATCGDGFVRVGIEQCDDGNQSNTDACLNSCKSATCGDSFVHTGVEECDDGNLSNGDACLNTCKSATCGDTFVEIGVEDCDDGNGNDNDLCVACKNARCGDGHVEIGVEECDDGNQSNGDACLNSCKNARCGDSYVDMGVEECDDGNGNDADACLNSCKNARCGDGVVEIGVEECDDANANNNDTCLNGCKNARCGDGVVEIGVEQCDDGNPSNGDACLNACKNARCGDGFLEMGFEQCDDGNNTNGDGCSAVCTSEGPPPDLGAVDAAPDQSGPADAAGADLASTGDGGGADAGAPDATTADLLLPPDDAPLAPPDLRPALDLRSAGADLANSGQDDLGPQTPPTTAGGCGCRIGGGNRPGVSPRAGRARRGHLGRAPPPPWAAAVIPRWRGLVVSCLLLAVTDRADARPRIAVLPFSGPQAARAHAEVARVARASGEVVPAREWAAASKRRRGLAAVAKQVGAQVVISGEVRRTGAYVLTISVRQGADGTVVAQLRYPLRGPRIDDATLRKLADGIAPAIDKALYAPEPSAATAREADAAAAPRQADTPPAAAGRRPAPEPATDAAPSPREAATEASPAHGAATDRPPWTPYFELSAGWQLGGRNFAFADSTQPLFRSKVTSGAHADLTAFPFAGLGARRTAASSAVAGLGVGASFDWIFWPDSVLCPGGVCGAMPQRYATTEYRLEAGLRWRWHVAPLPLRPEVLVSGEYGLHAFAVAKKADGTDVGPPDTTYSYLTIGVGLRMPVAAIFALSAGLHLHALLGAGSLQTGAEYGSGGGFGLRPELAAELLLLRHLTIKASGYYERFSLSFDGGPGATKSAGGGATDQYWGCLLSIGARL